MKGETRKGIEEPVMMSGEDELDIDAMLLSNLKNLVGLYWVNNGCFFTTLINDPANQSTHI